MQLVENIVDLDAADIHPVAWDEIIPKGIELDTLRLDKIDPVISGNKWFKLKYYLQAAFQENKTSVLTFGGAWSNHIVATACAAKKAGLESIGIIRGEAPAVYSSALQTASAICLLPGKPSRLMRKRLRCASMIPAGVSHLKRSFIPSVVLII